MFFKKKGLPDEGELVLCTVKRISPHASFVRLDEYDNAEAMLHISEVSTKWIKDIRDYLSMNKIIVCKVMQSRPGEVDVSLKRVSAGDRKRKMDAVRTEMRVEKLIEFIGKKIKEDPKKVLREVGTEIVQKYETLSDFYDVIRTDGIDIIDKLNLPKKLQTELKDQINEQLKSQQVHLQKNISLISHAADGVFKIKSVMKKIMELSKGKDVEVAVRYVSAPKYVVDAKAQNYKLLENYMKQVSEKIEEFAEKNEVEFKELDA